MTAPELNSARITGYSAAFTDNTVDCIEEQKDKIALSHGIYYYYRRP
jgi:hypothetical protein